MVRGIMKRPSIFLYGLRGGRESSTDIAVSVNERVSE
jgi:hypothetical protein